MNYLDFLIKYLEKERKEEEKVPSTINQKIRLYRALVNVRMPNEISSEFLEKEDVFLNEYFKSFKIVDVKDIEIINDKIALFKGDITKIKIDAIVNPANSGGLGCFMPNHNCLDNQITTFAGVRLRLEEKEIMDKIKVLDTGKAFITNGYNLMAKKVIHTVGPIVNNKLLDYQKDELKNCYINCLHIAKENGLRTIAFPAISTGVFRFPKDIAAKIAIDSVKLFLKDNNEYFDKIVFALYTEEDYDYYIRRFIYD